MFFFVVVMGRRQSVRLLLSGIQLGCAQLHCLTLECGHIWHFGYWPYWTVDSGYWTVDIGHWTLDILDIGYLGRWTLDNRLSKSRAHSNFRNYFGPNHMEFYVGEILFRQLFELDVVYDHEENSQNTSHPNMHPLALCKLHHHHHQQHSPEDEKSILSKRRKHTGSFQSQHSSQKRFYKWLYPRV